MTQLSACGRIHALGPCPNYFSIVHLPSLYHYSSVALSVFLVSKKTTGRQNEHISEHVDTVGPVCRANVVTCEGKTKCGASGLNALKKERVCPSFDFFFFYQVNTN